MPRGKITARQQRYLFSKVSPLTEGERDRLDGEIRSGATRIIKSKGGRRKPRRSRGR